VKKEATGAGLSGQLALPHIKGDYPQDAQNTQDPQLKGRYINPLFSATNADE